MLADLAAGANSISHEALDAHPRRRAADYLRHVLVANGVLPARDEALARLERFLAATLAGVTGDPTSPGARLRHLAGAAPAPRDPPNTPADPAPTPATPAANIVAAAAFLNWLADRGIHAGPRPAKATSTPGWPAGPAGYQVRDFLAGPPTPATPHAARPRPGEHDRAPPPVTTQRWALVARLLHDDNLELTDRVAGACCCSTASNCPGSPQ